MSNISEIVNRTQAINAEIKSLRQREDMTLADYKRLASLRTNLLTLCPPQRYVWLCGRPVIDLFYEVDSLCLKLTWQPLKRGFYNGRQ